jgi:hypothetical protein
LVGQSQENDYCKFVDSEQLQGCDDSQYTVYSDSELSIDPDYLASFEPVVINIFFGMY